MKRLADAKAKPASEKPATVYDDFWAKVGKMSADQAGTEWAALALTPDKQVRFSGYMGQSDPAMSVLPGPASWPAIDRALTATKETLENKGRLNAVKLVSHLLVGDKAGTWSMIDKLSDKEPVLNAKRTLVKTFAEWTGDVDRMIKAYKMPSGGEDGRNFRYRGGGEEFPDLIAIEGREKATAHYLEVLKGVKQSLSFKGKEAQRLVRQLALEHVNELAAPQYSLAASFDGTALFLALDKKFGTKDSGDRTAAEGFYALSSILAGKPEVAKNRVSSLQSTLQSYEFRFAVQPVISRPDNAKKIDQFLYETLADKPTVDLWDFYATEAINVKTVDRALALVQKLVDAKKSKTYDAYITLLLAKEQTDKAIEFLTAQLPGTSTAEAAGSYALKLANLGDVLGRDDLVKLALFTLFADKAQESVSLDDDLPLIIAHGLAADAENFLASKASEALSHDESVRSAQNYLESLARLYYHSGRYSDVVSLLDNSPDWQVTDVGQFDMYGNQEPTFTFMVARSLAEVGRNDVARRVLDAVLARNQGYDPAYELLVKLDGDACIPKLDEMAAKNRFQERPLIWKAYLLHKASKDEEAEKAVRAAIAIDPSDGETHGGHRMFAYTVLADIREARGDKAEAEQMRNVVRAIRMSEKADKFLAVGLIRQATTMYAQSLEVFQDAYCIQSRLAVQQAELGNLKEAEEHFQRAFELMPDSFGEMESHCFGCEGVFTTGPAAGIAERVFTRLLKERPDKAQVHYLMGYLRMEQGRTGEAQPYLLKAVELDPNYINAWTKLLATSDEVPLKADQKAKAEAAILRLTPEVAATNFPYMENSLTDGLNYALYYTTAQNRAPAKPLPDELYPLAATARNQKGDEERALLNRISRSAAVRRPGDAIARNTMIAMALALESYLAREEE